MTVTWNVRATGGRDEVATLVAEAVRQGASAVEPDGHAAAAALNVAGALDLLIRKLAISKTEGDNAREIEVTSEGTLDVDGESNLTLTMRAIPLPVEEVTT